MNVQTSTKGELTEFEAKSNIVIVLFITINIKGQVDVINH